jgi:hypothetical protein
MVYTNFADQINLVKYIPSFIPFAPRRTAIPGRNVIRNMVDRPFLHVKSEMASAVVCFYLILWPNGSIRKAVLLIRLLRPSYWAASLGMRALKSEKRKSMRSSGLLLPFSEVSEHEIVSPKIFSRLIKGGMETVSQLNATYLHLTNKTSDIWHCTCVHSGNGSTPGCTKESTTGSRRISEQFTSAACRRRSRHTICMCSC